MNACCVWDFTWWGDLDENKMIVLLEERCKKWAFQEEEAPKTGELHFQGRMSLKVKKRLVEIVKEWPKGFHFSVTSNENKTNMFYVMKEDTRVRGPWTDENDKPMYIPRDVRKIEKLRPWQQDIHNRLSVVDDRKVHIIIDTTGGKGKSSYVRWAMCHKYGQIIPFVNDFKDIMRMVCDMPISPIYYIDMPRGISKEKLKGLYAGIEMVKTGYAYDDRYKFKQILFDPPNICVFTNTEPNLKYLSADRWVILELCVPGGELGEQLDKPIEERYRLVPWKARNDTEQKP